MFFSHLILWLISLQIIKCNDNDDCWMKDYTVAEFEENNSKRCHILLFYSPGCPHCVKFLPEWYQLASKTCAANFADRIITQINCMDPWKNELCFMQKLESFPSIIGYPQGSHRGLIYNGPEIRKFVNQFIEQICSPSSIFDREIGIKHKQKTRM